MGRKPAWVAVGGWFYSLWDCGPPWVGGFACRGVMGRRGWVVLLVVGS